MKFDEIISFVVFVTHPLSFQGCIRELFEPFVCKGNIKETNEKGVCVRERDRMIRFG